MFASAVVRFLALVPIGLDLGDSFDLVAGVLAFVLFSLSAYAWYLRRQRPLLLVAVAFLVFFAKVVVEIQPTEGVLLDLVAVTLQMVFLLLVFFALFLRPRKEPATGRT